MQNCSRENTELKIDITDLLYRESRQNSKNCCITNLWKHYIRQNIKPIRISFPIYADQTLQKNPKIITILQLKFDKQRKLHRVVFQWFKEELIASYKHTHAHEFLAIMSQANTITYIHPSVHSNLSTFGKGNIHQWMFPMTLSGPRFTKEMDDLLIHQSNYEVKINHQISDTGLSVIPECSLRRRCTFQQVRNVISL